MQDCQHLIAELRSKLSQIKEFKYEKVDLTPLKQELSNLQNSPLQRESQALECTMKGLHLQQERNSQAFSQLSDQRLKFAKQIIELEEEIEKLQTELNEQTKLEDDFKIQLQSLTEPSKNALFVELMKGFNIKGKLVVKKHGIEDLSDNVDELWEKL
ncbi:hypothetical protein M153_11900018673 [Pseudoloma neurophilia]|uniref:Uncharacterized protein n=1 Tax=Pseudoloma neurophilia TaxID=146866 RepID=A0A0R0M706_9MICR|nr:hypothetical protein M153_11900018673 [Pseudoloma neurophilia]